MLTGWRERRTRRTAEALRKGEIIRQLHWQCWRADAPPLETPLADLVEVLPVLIESGSVGLVWPRLWHRADELGAVGAVLRAAYDAQVAHNARVERDIARVVTRLREHDVEPVLIKGLAVARLYPAPLIRTAGDIDLVVRDEDYATAKAALADLHLSFHGESLTGTAYTPSFRSGRNAAVTPEHIFSEVDLHSYGVWYEKGLQETCFFTAVSDVLIGKVRVHVPCEEDHMRALCLHFIRHSAVRPLRLCDIAALSEEKGETIRWERVVHGDRRSVDQIRVALRLSNVLVGSRLDRGFHPGYDKTLPNWVAPAVLVNWGKNLTAPGPALPEIMRSPSSVLHTMRRRWLDDLSVTVRVGAPFNSFPRSLIRIAALVRYGTVTLPRQAHQIWGSRRATLEGQRRDQVRQLRGAPKAARSKFWDFGR